MTTLTKKLTLAAIAAATLAATPAMANSYRHWSGQGGPMASEGYTTSDAGDAGYGAYAAAPGGYEAGMAPGVISYDRYAGWDPDPAIRLMLKRDATGKDAQ